MAEHTTISRRRAAATAPATSSDVLPTPFAASFMESTCARGMLRRQLSHLRDVPYGMPDTEAGVMTTARHFSTLPPLQIQTGSEGFRGGISFRSPWPTEVSIPGRGCQWPQPAATSTKARCEYRIINPLRLALRIISGHQIAQCGLA